MAIWSLEIAGSTQLACGVYAPPRIAQKHILNALSVVLQNAGTAPLLVMGDLNIDLAKVQNRSFITSMEAIGLTLSTSGFTTRLRSKLDHIWHNGGCLPVETFIGVSTYSDHLPLCAYLG
jgi:endonuclease/exonuclease/phosphatase (EEP) superfamily protein YafD